MSELVKVFCAAQGDNLEIDKGVAAVVRAISDMLRATDHAELWAAANVIDEILGDQTEDVAAGGSTREDEHSVEQLGATASHASTSPAAAYYSGMCSLKNQIVCATKRAELEAEVDRLKAEMKK